MTVPGRARAIGINALLAVVPVVLLLGAAEFVLRQLEGRSDDTPLYAGGEPPFVLRLQPNVRAWRSGVEIRTNALGLRGPGVAHPKPPGTVRILCVGDSYTFGTGVHEEDTLPAQLQRELTTRAPGVAIECINLGIGGANAYDNAARTDAIGLPLEPDVVLHLFLFNDVWQMERGVAWMQNRTRRPGEGRVAHDRRRDQLFLVRYAAPRAAELWRLVTRRGAGKAAIWNRQFEDDVPAWRVTREELLRSRAACEARGARFVLAVLPMFASFEEGRYPLPDYRRNVLAWCDAEGIPRVDLHEPFAGQSGRRYWINPLDSHPDAEACKIMAIHLAEALMAREVIRTGDSPMNGERPS